MLHTVWYGTGRVYFLLNGQLSFFGGTVPVPGTYYIVKSKYIINVSFHILLQRFRTVPENKMLSRKILFKYQYSMRY